MLFLIDIQIIQIQFGPKQNFIKLAVHITMQIKVLRIILNIEMLI